MRTLHRLVPLISLETLTAAPILKSTRASSKFRARPSVGKSSVCLRCGILQLSRPYSENGPSLKVPKDSTAGHAPYEEQSTMQTAASELKAPISHSLASPSLDGASSRKTPKELPSQEERRRWHISRSFSHVMDHLQSNLFIAGQRLNDLTGYSGIEALKKEIEGQEDLLRTSRDSVRNFKEAYSRAIAQRSASQREVNELLQRRSSWSRQDAERFTSLFTSDHANEQAEVAAQEALSSAERTAEEAGTMLSRSILARYHEEQIWSDKIRRMSTWGTWGLMGVNVLLFLIFQIGVEPWRRKRLVKGFEEKVMEALEREGAVNSLALAAFREESQSVRIQSENRPVLLSATAEAIPEVALEAIPEVVTSHDGAALEPENTSSSISASAQPAESQSLHNALLLTQTDLSPRPRESPLQICQDLLHKLFSERLIQLRMLDVTFIALEGAAAGAAMVGFLVVLLRHRILNQQ